ncbi:MAG: molybdopterin-dependent oxidoreductase [Oleiphilaceae bacterium]|uniref:molybdopterin-dependent oxidoreductase n=3 Tax=Oleiphilus sp. HI0125 TaxID=1822266 RepID=UPI0007C3B750|nr:molybdopterin-dependent oxidoreductase [Oleiphilus sp. HI0125]KZZ63161.1 dehydrogenase [Oleiphilus sp. HI0125]MCH2160135.1 molybdopterin-dependent oxidoreductase [Oleiphilaceae bacterium]
MTNTESLKHFRTCNLCEAMCGVVIEHDQTQVLSIKGDKDDPFSKGHICPKALALKDYHEDPDRLRTPMLKTEQGWKQISWGKAFDIAAKRLGDIQKQYGQDAVGLYLGNPNVHHHGNVLFLMNLYRALGTKNRFSATSNDQLPHMRANYEMFGHQGLFPVPDIDHTDLFILLGSNPAASNGSLMSAPDYLGRLKGIRKRGGEVILIDPKRSETAKVVDTHLFIKPGTDAYMLLGMIHTLFDEGLVDIGRLQGIIEGVADVQLMSSDFSPESVADVCGIKAEYIRELARKLAETPRAAIFGRMGTSTQEFGGLATWFIYVLNILTNHLDERGGLMFTKPAADLVEISSYLGEQGSSGRFKTVTGLPEFSGELPSSAIADQIETKGEQQIRAMITIAGNPVISSPNSNRLEKAFNSLDFMLCVDSHLNETTKHADLILPGTSQLEQSHYDVALNMLAVRNVAKYSPALFNAPKNSKHDWQIMHELTHRLSAGGSLVNGVKELARYRTLKQMGPDGVLDVLLRIGPYGTQLPGTSSIGAFLIDTIQDIFSPSHPLRKALDNGPYGSQNRGLSKGLCIASLKNYPHGVDLGSLQSALPDRLFTKHKHIQLVPKSYMTDMPRLRKRLQELSNTKEPVMLLIGRRDVRSNNSWMHNTPRLVKGKNRCTAQINTADAKRLKLKHGELVKVSSDYGAVTIPCEVTDDIMTGVMSIPHGWGHDHEGTRLSVASQKPGVNLNVLISDQFVDKLTGTSALNGMPVRVEAIASTATKKRRKTTTKKTTKAVS